MSEHRARRSMDRMGVLARHVDPRRGRLGPRPGRSAACAGDAAARAPEGSEPSEPPARRPKQKKDLSDLPPEKAQAIAALRQIVSDADKLLADGTWPSLSFFDMGLVTKHEMGPPTAEMLQRYLRRAEDDASRPLAVLDALPGPWRSAPSREAKLQLLGELAASVSGQHDLFKYAQWQQQFGSRGLGSNIAVPSIAAHGMGSGARAGIKPRVIVADPADANRISRSHVRKEGNFEGSLFDGVISTTDNEHWRRQRQHLAEAFLPMGSLAAILPVSLARARQCAERLAEAARGGAAVDMSDFLLHEAQAQLQLALLGAPEEFMEATNKQIRGTFAGDCQNARVGSLGEAMKSLMSRASDPSFALPSEGCPVRGPLSRAVATGSFEPSANYGNMLLILFAGHDTTGHTMTWLLFELARHPEYQAKLQQEVDAFFERLAGREPEYKDLAQLPFMDRCITETLRLWPAVANGTFRQLQFDDTVTGADGAPVTLSRGTSVQIVNWSRHRNPDLWGSDADEFNPHRSFQPQEVARVGCPGAAVSPESERFSPFAHAPRTCLGRNFAQMEMRLIMLYLLQRFDFTLAPPYDALQATALGAAPGRHEFRGLNQGTMGPMDLERTTKHWWGERHYIGLKMVARPRQSPL